MAAGRGRFRAYQLTLDASAQTLQEGIPNKSDGSFDSTVAGAFEDNPLCQYIDIQADDGNSNPIYQGWDNVVSSASHSVRIPAPSSSVPDPPYRIEGPVTPKQVWVIGTNAEKLNVTLAVG